MPSAKCLSAKCLASSKGWWFMCDAISGYIRVDDGQIIIAHPSRHSATVAAMGLTLDVREALCEWEWRAGEREPTVRHTIAKTASQLVSSIIARFPDRAALVDHCRPMWERRGNYLIESQEDADRVPERVSGDLICTASTITLPRLTSIGGYADFRSLTDAAGLSALASIGGYADFRSLTDAAGLSALASIGGYADFRSLTDAAGLSALASIGGDAYFRSLTDAAGLSALASIGRDAYFRSLTDAQLQLVPALRPAQV